MTNPSNLNYLSPLNFQFAIKKAPTVNFFCTDVNLPGITLGEAEQDTPLVRIPVPGDHLTFNELTITFNVDEDMKNYKEMYDWLINVGFPESFDQYAVQPDDAIFTDCSLIVLSSKLNPIAQIDFRSAFVTALSDLQFSTKESDVAYITCTASLRYKLYTVTTLN